MVLFLHVDTERGSKRTKRPVGWRVKFVGFSTGRIVESVHPLPYKSII